MNTIQFSPEILVAGFSHFVWFTLLVFWLLGVSPRSSLNFISTIAPGTAIVLIAVISGISFFLGTLAEQMLIVVSYVCKKKEDRKSILDLSKKCKNNNELSNALDKAWSAKSFFRSISFAGFVILVLLLILDSKYESSNHWSTIIIISIILESATITAWIYLKKRIKESDKD